MYQMAVDAEECERIFNAQNTGIIMSGKKCTAISRSWSAGRGFGEIVKTGYLHRAVNAFHGSLKQASTGKDVQHMVNACLVEKIIKLSANLFIEQKMNAEFAVGHINEFCSQL